MVLNVVLISLLLITYRHITRKTGLPSLRTLITREIKGIMIELRLMTSSPSLEELRFKQQDIKDVICRGAYDRETAIKKLLNTRRYRVWTREVMRLRKSDANFLSWQGIGEQGVWLARYRKRRNQGVKGR